MTWMLFSRSIGRGSFPSPPRSPAAGERGATLSLADPLHVAVDGDLAHLHDLAVLDHDEPPPVGRAMVLGRVGEGWRQPPGVEVLEGLERVLDRFTGRVRPRPLDRLGGHDDP